jgi:hypothetical protein
VKTVKVKQIWGRDSVRVTSQKRNFQNSITDEKILKQIENATPERMFPFKGKLIAEEMKALVPVIRAFGG